jgi:hypothetical protein
MKLKNKKIKTVVFGLGNIGLLYDITKTKKIIETHSKALFLNKNFILSGAIDKDKKKLSIFYKKYKIHGYQKIETIYKKIKKIDLLIVSTPHKNHYECIKKVLSYYKPKLILCEKPMGFSYKDSQKICKICKIYNIPLRINYIRRLEKYKILKIKKNLDKKLNEATVYYSKNEITNASHFIDLFDLIFGGFNKIIHKPKYINKIKTFKLSFKRGTVIYKNVDIEDKKKHTYKIENKNKVITVSNNFLTIINKASNKKDSFKSKISFSNLTLNEILNFFDKKDNLLAKPKEASKIQKVIEELLN